MRRKNKSGRVRRKERKQSLGLQLKIFLSFLGWYLHAELRLLWGEGGNSGEVRRV